MILLTGGLIQNCANSPVANGSIEFVINTDATVIASPYGLVQAAIPVVFQFDDDGNIQADAYIWSNAELNPQNMTGLGTWYKVTFYDANGARINQVATLWQFVESDGSTVDISNMVATTQNTIYYPFPTAASSGLYIPTIVPFSSTPVFVVPPGTAPVLTLTNNVSNSTIIGLVVGETFVMQIIENATGGYTFVWPANFRGAMTISTDPNAVNTQWFWYDGTTVWAIAPGTVN